MRDVRALNLFKPNRRSVVMDSFTVSTRRCPPGNVVCEIVRVFKPLDCYKMYVFYSECMSLLSSHTYRFDTDGHVGTLSMCL